MNVLESSWFDAALARLPNPALQAVRDLARQRFVEQGLPTTKDEAWRYTDLRPVAELTARWLQNDGPAAPQATSTETGALPNVDALWLTVRNGALVSSLDENVADGLSIRRLSELTQPAAIRLDDALISLNAALMQDALIIEVRAGTLLERPIGIFYHDDATASSSSSHTRVSIDVGEGATADVIEVHSSSGSAEHYANAVTEIRAKRSATVRWLQLQQRDDRHMMTSTTDVRVAANSSFEGASVQLGGKLVRNAVNMVAGGNAASAAVTGLTISDKNQHIDNRVLADHEHPGGTTRQHYRSIAAGRSRCIFNSKALVQPGADGTDAEQSSHNLLLSNGAEIDTKPELEIYADDVKCAHGATVGELDENALFYLRSRGVAKEQAQQMLTKAFADQVVAKLPIATAQDVVERAIGAKLEQVIEANNHE